MQTLLLNCRLVMVFQDREAGNSLEMAVNRQNRAVLLQSNNSDDNI